MAANDTQVRRDVERLQLELEDKLRLALQEAEDALPDERDHSLCCSTADRSHHAVNAHYYLDSARPKIARLRELGEEPSEPSTNQIEQLRALGYEI